jgi:ATP-binding cassette subfamily C protein CydC
MLASILLGTLTIACGIGLMSVSAYIIARAALQPPIAELQVAIASVRAFGIARGLLRYAERLLSHDTTFRALNRLRVWIYRHIEPLELSRLEAFRSGDLLARLVADVSTLENFFVRALAPSGTALLIALAMSLLFSTFHPSLTLVFLIFFSLAMILVPGLGFRWTQRLGEDMIRIRSEMYNAALDGILGAAELLAFNQADRHREELHSLTARYYHAQHRAAWASGFTNALSTTLANLSVIALFLVAIPLVRSGGISGVNLAVLVLANLASYEAVLGLPAAYQELNRDLAAGERIFGLVGDLEQGMPRQFLQVRKENRPPKIEFRHVSYTYPGRYEPAIKDISLTLHSCQSLAVVGPSGSGKTTLIETLLLFRPAYAGEILIDGQELLSLDPDAVRRLFSVVPQEPFLFHSTIRENLMLARPEASDLELTKAIEIAQLDEFINRLPTGLDTLVGEHGYQLSAGERQRLSIARAILTDAPLVIMDEATSHLDPETGSRLERSLTPILENRSSLLISHRLAALKGHPAILVLDRGRVIQRGSYADLIEQEGWFARSVQQEHVDQVLQTISADINLS